MIKTNIIKLTIIHCLTPLFVGGLLYIFFRSTDLRMFHWFSFLGLDHFITSARDYFSVLKNDLPNWIYFSLPDGLWVYSFTSALLIYWRNDIHKVKFWLLIPLTTGVLIEVLQGVKLFPGTFDFLDLAFTSLGLLLSAIIINYKFKQNEKTVF